MATGELEAYTHIQYRDHLGRYLGSLPEKARRTLEEIATQSAAIARANAPSKTGALRASIQGVVITDWQGAITVGTDHWRYTEYGAAPHEITGNVHFWWEREGRPWFPGANTISHPGTKAVHYMQHGADYAKKHMMSAVRRNFG